MCSFFKSILNVFAHGNIYNNIISGNIISLGNPVPRQRQFVATPRYEGVETQRSLFELGWRGKKKGGGGSLVSPRRWPRARVEAGGCKSAGYTRDGTFCLAQLACWPANRPARAWDSENTEVLVRARTFPTVGRHAALLTCKPHTTAVPDPWFGS